MIIPLVVVIVLVSLLWVVVRVGGHTAVHVVPATKPRLAHPNSESTEWLGLAMNRGWRALLAEGDGSTKKRLEESINAAIMQALSKQQQSHCGGQADKAQGSQRPKWGVQCLNAAVANIGTSAPTIAAIRVHGEDEDKSGKSNNGVEAPSPSVSTSQHPHHNQPPSNVLTFDCEVVFPQGNALSLEASGTVTIMSRATKWKLAVSDIHARACLSVTLTAHPQDRVSPSPPTTASDGSIVLPAKTKGVPVTICVSLISEPEFHCSLETEVGDPWTVHNFLLVPYALQWVMPMITRRLLSKPSVKEFKVHLPHVDWASYMAEESDGDSVLNSSSPSDAT